MANFTEHIQVLIDTETSKAVSGLNNIKTQVASAEGSFNKLKTGAGGVFSAIGTSGPLALASVGTAVTGFAVKAIGDFQNTAQSVLHFKEVAGGTAESASRWIETFDDYGVSADTASTLVGKLAKTAETSPTGLEAYGASVIKAKDGTIDLDATLLNVIDTMHNAPDEASRAALGAAAFGKGWQDVAKMVDVGAEGIKQDFDSISGAQIFSEKDLENSEKFRMALDDLSDKLAGLENTIGAVAIPVLTNLLNILGEIADAADLIPGPLVKIAEAALKYNPIALPYTAAAKALDILGSSSEKAVVVAEPLNKVTGEVAGSVADLKAQTDLQNEALKEAAKEYKNATDAITAHGKALADQADALRASSDSQFAADKAARDLSDTFEALPKKLDDIAASGDSAAKITRDQQQAFDDAAQAAVAMADSQVKLQGDQDKAKGATQSHTAALDTWNASILTAAANSKDELHAAIVQHIADVNGIPPEKVTEILASTPNLDEQKKLIDEASAARKLTITADANTDPAQRAVNAFMANVAAHPAYIDVIGRLSTQGQAHARGGGVFADQLALVGEEGPELVILPGGSYVMTAHETKGLKMYAGGGVVGTGSLSDLFGPSGKYASDDEDPLRKLFGGGADFANWMIQSGPYRGQTLGALFGPGSPFYRTGKDALEVLFGGGADFALLDAMDPQRALGTFTPAQTEQMKKVAAENAAGPVVPQLMPFGWFSDYAGLHGPSGSWAPPPTTTMPAMPPPPPSGLDAWGLPMTAEVGNTPYGAYTGLPKGTGGPPTFGARAVGGGGRQQITINITGGIWMGSKAEIGRQLVEAIKAYERISSPVLAA